jgi:hypothetical protein
VDLFQVLLERVKKTRTRHNKEVGFYELCSSWKKAEGEIPLWAERKEI